MKNKLNILISPLDWGLGHCSRCVSIIKHLQNMGATIFLATNEQQKKYFEQEINNVQYLTLEGYNITYGKSKWTLVKNLVLQIPTILKTIQREHTWLQKIIVQKNIDIVISDNRYGMYSSLCKSIFISHQTNIIVPVFGKIVNYINHKKIKKFDACWVPDFEGNNNLSGKLSYPTVVKSVQYIGALSRLEKTTFASIPNNVLVILSGPEPQKSILLSTIISQLGNSSYTVKIAGAQTLFPNENILPGNIVFVPNMDSAALQQHIQQSQIVISRSGYTTLMDLAKLNKHAILIPTPAQTEQVYLGRHSSQNNWHVVVAQSQLNLLEQIPKFVQTQFADYNKDWNFENFKAVLNTIA